MSKGLMKRSPNAYKAAEYAIPRLSPREARLYREAGLIVLLAASNGAVFSGGAVWFLMRGSPFQSVGCVAAALVGVSAGIFVAWPFVRNYTRS